MDAGPGSARQREVLVILLPGKRSHPPRWNGEREWHRLGHILVPQTLEAEVVGIGTRY